MGPPGTGVGTCMRMVAPILLVYIVLCLLEVDSFIPIKVCNSEGNAARYTFRSNC